MTKLAEQIFSGLSIKTWYFSVDFKTIRGVTEKVTSLQDFFFCPNIKFNSIQKRGKVFTSEPNNCFSPVLHCCRNKNEYRDIASQAHTTSSHTTALLLHQLELHHRQKGNKEIKKHSPGNNRIWSPLQKYRRRHLQYE